MTKIRRISRRLVAPFFGVGVHRVPGLWFLYRHGYKVFGPRGLHEVAVHGCRMVADFGDAEITPSLWLRGQYEPTATRAFKALIGPGSLIADIGAHIGYYTLLGAKLTGKRGAVLASEPNLLTRSLLELNVALNGFSNISIISKACSDHLGQGTLYTHQHACGSGSLESTILHYAELPQEVALTTLDTEWRQRWDTGPTFVKVDVQGHEARVLDGASSLLEEYRPALMFEFNPRQLMLSGSPPRSVLVALTTLGYKLLLVDEETRELRPGSPKAILDVCLSEMPDGSGFRNIVAAQQWHLTMLRNAGLLGVLIG
jgi:FkbM family methyltransferase